MDDPLDHATTMDGTLEDWATDSLRAARQAYQDPATGRRIEPGTVLGEAYFDANLPVVRRCYELHWKWGAAFLSISILKAT